YLTRPAAQRVIDFGILFDGRGLALFHHVDEFMHGNAEGLHLLFRVARRGRVSGRRQGHGDAADPDQSQPGTTHKCPRGVGPLILRPTSTAPPTGYFLNSSRKSLNRTSPVPTGN